MNKWINLIVYQAVWVIAVAGAARGVAWAGPVAVAAFGVWMWSVSEHRRADMHLAVLAAVVGFFADSLFAHTGLLRYASSTFGADWAPLWIVALWINFSLTLNHSLAYLKSHLGLASLLGAVGAPLAYWAAFKGWNAITFADDPTKTLMLLAMVWAVIAPMLCAFARRVSSHDSSRVVVSGAIS